MTAQPSGVTLAGHEVLSGELTLPIRGLWEFLGEIDTVKAGKSSVPSGAAVLRFARDGAEAVEFRGTIRDIADFHGRAGVRLVGGVGGLSVPLPAQGYSAHPVPVALSDLLEDIATLTHEKLSQETLDYVGAVSLARWSRVGDGEAALDELADAHELDWRMNADGTLRFAPETWPEATPAKLYDQGNEGIDGILFVAPDAATLLPGTTILGKRITQVVYRVGSGSIRAELYYRLGELGEFRAAVRRQIPELPFLRSLEGTVLLVNADGTLQVRTDEAATLDRVPLLVGGPRQRVTLESGDRVQLHFAAGDPRKYFALGIEQDPTADKGVAFVGCDIDCGYFAVVPLGAGYKLAASTSADPTATRVTGTITSGHLKLKLTNQKG